MLGFSVDEVSIGSALVHRSALVAVAPDFFWENLSSSGRLKQEMKKLS